MILRVSGFGPSVARGRISVAGFRIEAYRVMAINRCGQAGAAKAGVCHVTRFDRLRLEHLAVRDHGIAARKEARRRYRIEDAVAGQDRLGLRPVKLDGTGSCGGGSGMRRDSGWRGLGFGESAQVKRFGLRFGSSGTEFVATNVKDLEVPSGERGSIVWHEVSLVMVNRKRAAAATQGDLRFVRIETFGIQLFVSQNRLAHRRVDHAAVEAGGGRFGIEAGGAALALADLLLGPRDPAGDHGADYRTQCRKH
ncbi:MAG: hypothetical protein IPG83_14840 [Novosphingobium sp.]|nr:hypothetical protein [Novosphingobium sp.]